MLKVNIVILRLNFIKKSKADCMKCTLDLSIQHWRQNTSDCFSLRKVKAQPQTTPHLYVLFGVFFFFFFFFFVVVVLRK